MFSIMAVWVIINIVGFIQRWDPYPFILLNLFLSVMGGMQGAVIIIADKRGQQIASELARHDFEVNQVALQKINEILESTLRVESAITDSVQ